MNAMDYNRYNYGTAAPAVEPRKIRESKNQYLYRASVKEEEIIREKAKTKATLSFWQTLTILACLGVMLAVFAIYIVGISDVNQAERSLVAARMEVENLQKENALLQMEIQENRDYNGIYVYATDTLGMRLPEKQQVITYTSRPSEYVVKSVDIPNE